MAKSNKEGRMLFDIRGRRRNVIKVVYAVLALLMGLSLILLAGPIGFLGGGGSSGNSAELFEEMAERIEVKLKEDPGDPNLLLNLTKAQINTANALSESEQGVTVLTVPARQELERASATWQEYLEATDEPSASGAQVASIAYFSLAQTSRTNREAVRNIDAAAEAQQIFAEQRPSVGSLSNLMLYQAYAGEFAQAKSTLAAAKKRASSKFERQQLETQLEEAEEVGREIAQQIKEAEQAGGQGTPGSSEALENPFVLPGG